jgi:hypothetical protein
MKLNKLQPLVETVLFCQVKLINISYIGNFLFKVWFIQDSGLFRVLAYTGFWFIQDSGLFRVLVYTGFWLIQGSGLYRILAYSGFGLD